MQVFIADAEQDSITLTVTLLLRLAHRADARARRAGDGLEQNDAYQINRINNDDLNTETFGHFRDEYDEDIDHYTEFEVYRILGPEAKQMQGRFDGWIPPAKRTIKESEIKCFDNVISRRHTGEYNRQICPWFARNPRGCSKRNCRMRHVHPLRQLCDQENNNTKPFVCTHGATCKYTHPVGKYELIVRRRDGIFVILTMEDQPQRDTSSSLPSKQQKQH